LASPLHKLVHTLSGAEKRYVHLYLKMFSGKKGQNHLLKDFLIVDEMAKDDEDTSTGSVQEKKIKLHGNPTKLYYKLLDILYLYHQSSDYLLSSEEEINIRRSKVLYNKGYYEEGERLLSKVIEKEEGSQRLRKIEAIEIKLQQALKKGDVNYLSESFEKDKTRLLNYFNEYQNIVDYESLWAMLKLETITNFFYSKTHDAGSLHYSQLLSDEKMALSPKAATIYHKIKGFLAMKEKDIKAAAEHTLRSVLIFHEHPLLLKSDLAEYLRAMRNLCIVYKFNGETDLALKTLEDNKINLNLNLSTARAEVQAEYFILYVILKLDICINGGKIDELEEELKDLEDDFKKMEHLLSEEERISTVFQLSIVNIHLKYYRKALRFNNYVKDKGGLVRKDLYNLSMMNDMAIHYLLNNFTLVESKLKTYKRHLPELEPIIGIEKEVAEHYAQILKTPDKSTFDEVYHSIKESLLKANKQDYEKFLALFYLK
jgi:hypothetical protein